MKVSRADVAKRAGVSEATVSYVFSKRRYVSEKLTEKVKRVAKELDYLPDVIARSMVMKTTNSIGVMTDDISSPLQMEVIKGIQSEAMRRGYFVNVCGGTEKLEHYIDNFISRRMDGVFISVISSHVSDKCIKKLLDRGISVIVTSARHVDDDRICGIELDMITGMRYIVEYLKSLGHTKIGYISSFDQNYKDDKRITGFKKAMLDCFNEKHYTIVMGEPPYKSDIETGFSLTRRLLLDESKPTAVITTNDMMAFGAIKAINSVGLSVPDDISVVGIDNIAFSQAFNPALTTLDHGGVKYGEKLFDILHTNIINKETVGRELFMPKLIIRDSCAQAKSVKT